jgi:hypothetical protein
VPRRIALTSLSWFVSYLVLLVLIVWGMNSFRQFALRNYGTRQATSQWQQWREAAGNAGQAGPVLRRAPQSREPPALVLMRDHFAACLGIALLLSSALFGTLMVAVRGALRPPATSRETTHDR